MRKSPVHYIDPAAISITPNANNSYRDLAVYVAPGTKIKVRCPRADIGNKDDSCEEWTIAGLNRQLGDETGTVPYTIYARLSRTNKDNGYIVFAKKIQPEGHEGEWVDAYSWLTLDTIDGFSVLYKNDNEEDVKVIFPTVYYIRLGDVSVAENGLRTVTLDTGILGTDDYNNNWALNPDTLPLRIEMSCTVNNEDVSLNPYVYWEQTLLLKATLTEGWSGTDIQRFHHWEISRKSDNDPDEDRHWLDGDVREGPFSSSGELTLYHHRNKDDFNGAVATTFTVMAMEQNPEDDTDYLVLKSATITILSETIEKYEMVLSDSIVSYNPQADRYTPQNSVSVGIRATSQRGEVFDLTNGKVVATALSVKYAPVGESSETVVPFTGDAGAIASGTIPVSTAFALHKSVNVRLVRSVTIDDGEGEHTQEIELARTTIAFVRDGEDSKVREWIYRLNSSVGYNSTTGTAGGQPVSGQTGGIDNCLLVDDFVPTGWSDDPTGVSASGDVEWESWRDYDEQNNRWGVFHAPVVHNRYAEDATTYEIIPSVGVINATADGTVTTEDIEVSACKTVGSVRTTIPLGLVPIGQDYYYVEYSIDGGTWTRCVMWIADSRSHYGVRADKVKTATDGIALRLKNTADDSAVLEITAAIKVVKDGAEGPAGEDAHEVQPNILKRTVFDRGIDFVKEAWNANWDGVTIDDENSGTTIQGRKSIRIDATAIGTGIGLLQDMLGIIKPDTYYTVSFNAFHSAGYLIVTFLNVINGNRVRMIDDSPIVDGVVTTVNEFNDIIVPAAWDGKRHVVTFKTLSAQYFSTEILRFQFWQSYDSTGYHSYPISCICMPKIEEGQAATAYLPHEDDLVGDAGTPGTTGHTGRFFYYAGVYDSSKIYRIEESQAPYVMFSGLDDNNVLKTGFFMLDYKGDEPPYINWPGDGHPAAPSFKTSGTVQWNPWTLMSSENQYYIAKAFFGQNAYLGSFIINGDWMISQYGTYKPDANTTIIVDETNFSQYSNAYTKFISSDPMATGSTFPCFAPNYAVDGKTGKTYQQETYIRGTIDARLLYVKPKILKPAAGVNTLQYTIDPINEPYSSFISDTSDNPTANVMVILPHAADYDGIEFSFFALSLHTQSQGWQGEIWVYPPNGGEKMIFYSESDNNFYETLGLKTKGFELKVKSVSGYWVWFSGNGEPIGKYPIE